MSLNKVKLGKKVQYPFPFSAYVVKSHSSGTTKHQPIIQYDPRSQIHQFGSILQINNKTSKQQSNHKSTEFRRTENILRQILIDVPKQPIVIPFSVPNLSGQKLRERKSRLKIKTLSPVKKQKITENKRIIASLRYQIVTFYALLDRREEYLAGLRGKGDLSNPSLRFSDIEERFVKYQDSKGRDKGRVKFNHVTNEQLRSLRYKAKPVILNHRGKKEEKEKVHYDLDQQEQDQEQEEKEEALDFATWKRRNGVSSNQKVFIIKGGYAQLRRGLLQRGWHQNQNVWSPHYDFKWTTRICDINFLNLKHGQCLNHFNNNHHLTSKYGITRRLKTLPLAHGVDSDRFYPKCFDLADQVDFENFVENFKFSFAQSVAKRFLVDKKRYENLQGKIRIIYEIMKRRAMNFQSLVNSINKGIFPTITSQDWQIITETVQLEQEELRKRVVQLRKSQKSELQEMESPQDIGYEQKLYERLDSRMRVLMSSLQEFDPQWNINGMRNVWIAKPNFMSRGRGIRCFNNIYDIADYCLGQGNQFVVQKYIQNPLLVQGKKFDIRQWVLIQDFNPQIIWFYEECYIRFCCDQYSLDNIYNRFIHLTNNSVQKYSKKHVAQKSMWSLAQFAEFVGAQQWNKIQEKMKNIVVWSIKSCEGQVLGRKGSLELVGYDFMIDSELNPWLIEINMSPSMDYSTPVTKKLVKMLLQDTAKVIAGSRKQKNTGLFTCIYRGNQDLTKYNLYKI